LISFRTVIGNQVWVHPQAIICIFEIDAAQVQEIENSHGVIVGLQVVGNSTFFTTQEEARRVVKELEVATGDDWKSGRTVEEDA